MSVIPETWMLPVDGSDAWQRGFIYMPVPIPMVPSVAETLADLARQYDGSESSGLKPHLPHGDPSNWSVEDFELLVRDRRSSIPRILLILDALAVPPETKLSTTELTRKTGLSRGELRGALSGLSRVVKTLRKDKVLHWPIQFTFGEAQREGLAQETYYWLSAKQAQRWLQVRGRRTE